MRSQYSKDEMLLAAAQKKPRWQALVDQAPQMTEQDIMALSEPLWVREALNILRQTNGVGQKQRIEAIVNRQVEAEVRATLAPKPRYEVYLWNGGERYLGTNTGDRDWTMQVEDGDTIMLITDEQIRIGDTALAIGHVSHNLIKTHARLVGVMTLSAYKAFHRALLNNRHKVV